MMFVGKEREIGTDQRKRGATQFEGFARLLHCGRAHGAVVKRGGPASGRVAAVGQTAYTSPSDGKRCQKGLDWRCFLKRGAG